MVFLLRGITSGSPECHRIASRGQKFKPTQILGERDSVRGRDQSESVRAGCTVSGMFRLQLGWHTLARLCIFNWFVWRKPLTSHFMACKAGEEGSMDPFAVTKKRTPRIQCSCRLLDLVLRAHWLRQRDALWTPAPGTSLKLSGGRRFKKKKKKNGRPVCLLLNKSRHSG